MIDYNIASEAHNMKVEENTKIFIVTELETLSRQYRISGVNSRKEAEEYIANQGLDSYSYFDEDSVEPQCVEIGERQYEDSKVKKIEIKRISPCVFFGRSFDSSNATRRFMDYRCKNNINGSESTICSHCVKRFEAGYTLKSQ